MFGRAKINVNLLIYLLNKKFYGKWRYYSPDLKLQNSEQFHSIPMITSGFDIEEKQINNEFPKQEKQQLTFLIQSDPWSSKSASEVPSVVLRLLIDCYLVFTRNFHDTGRESAALTNLALVWCHGLILVGCPL